MNCFHLDALGRWSYAAALVPYYALLFGLVWHFRIVCGFRTWRFFFGVTVLMLVFLGVLFEWLADILYVWTFPPGRDLFMIRVPIFGWFTGHQIPVCEFLWIVGVVPLFYYLYLWATLVFCDIIFVVDKDRNTYKKEERWVGFYGETRLLCRRQGMKDRKYEHQLLKRRPGFLARLVKNHLHAPRT